MSPKEANRYLEKENAKWPQSLVGIPEYEWPPTVEFIVKPVRVLRSRLFLVQVFEAPAGTIRLSCIRASLKPSGWWDDGISWEDLMRLKEEAGYGNSCGVEVYPPNADVVNVANMRHLWILPDVPAYVWRSRR